MAETKGQTQKQERTKYLGFVLSFKDHAIEYYSRKKERAVYLMRKLYEMIAPVIVFFTFLFSLFRGFFLGIKHGIQSLISMVQCILHFEYKQFFFTLLATSKEYSLKAKAKMYQIVWVPIKKRIYRLRKHMRKKLLDVRIYWRGFLELCRRLFLLLSDYTPGGQLTVAFLLVLLTIFLGIEMFRYSRLVFQLLDMCFSTLMFLLSPLLWTLRDVWAVIAVVLNLFLSLLRYIWLLVLIFFKGIANFIVRVLTAFLSVISRILGWIFELRCVQYAWHIFLELTLMTMEVFIFKVIPVLMVIFSHLITFSTIASTYFYDYFVVAYAVEEKQHECLSNTRICAAIFTTICLILAYRLRKNFPSNLCQEIEEEGSTLGSGNRARRLKTARYSSAGKRDNTTGHEDEVHFQYSSSAHICIGFLRGECKKGRRCEGHHCPWPYHWQYRVPVQGWKSFSPEDGDTIEQLYCNPTNEIIKTSDIDPDISAVTRRSHVKSDTPVRLDFQQMRMEVNYYRSEIRRLSTESSVKSSSDDLATKWIWYRLNDQEEWTEYGNKKSSIPKQDAIEASYIRRESSYNYKKETQDYRIYFFMTPMYERSMNPGEYKRRLVRRRPEYRPIDA